MTTVLVIGGAPQAQSLNALLVATNDYDVVFVESIERCYACFRRVVPDRVIISSDVDDVATCQLLSMMRADRCSSRALVVTCQTLREPYDLDDDLGDLDQHPPTPSLVAPMN
jgi:PleD family two-component response regulator